MQYKEITEKIIGCAYAALDVDTELDFQFAEYLMTKRMKMNYKKAYLLRV